MRRDRAVAWGGIVLAALLVGFLLGRCTAPDVEATAAPEPTAATVPVPAPAAPSEPAAIEPEPTPDLAITPTPDPAAALGTGPATTPSPTPSATPTPGERVHVVVAGDTLNGLAATFYGDAFCFDELAELNDLVPSAGLRIGQELTIAPLGDCTPVG